MLRKSISKLWIKILIIIFILIGFAYDIKIDSIEEMDIPAVIGSDILINEHGNVIYEIPILVNTYKSNGDKYSIIREGVGKNIGEAREDRQLKTENQFMIGIEKIYILSENTCRFGIETGVDSLFKNPYSVDSGYIVVCKGKSKDYLEIIMNDYETSTDFLANQVKSLKTFNFFSDNYKVIDLYVRFVAEGRNAILPYVEIINNKIQVTGLALFENSKMIRKIGIDETKMLNILKFNNVKGILTIDENSKRYINMSAKTKRKVTCKRINGKYYFNINLKVAGKIVNNELYDDIKTDVAVQKKFQQDMENKIKKDAERFIDKMQHEYKLDCLSFGRIAAAKYGRRTGADWNKIISESEINVDVKVKIETNLRGDF